MVSACWRFVGLGVDLCLVILQVLRVFVILLIVFWCCLRVCWVVGFNSVVIFNSLLIWVGGFEFVWLYCWAGVFLFVACLGFCDLCQFGYIGLFMLVVSCWLM